MKMPNYFFGKTNEKYELHKRETEASDLVRCHLLCFTLSKNFLDIDLK
jgi:hypothetical protein